MQKRHSANLCFICVHPWRENFLKHDRFSFSHDEQLVFDSMHTRGFAQALEWFFERFVAQAKTSVMHRHECPRLEFIERAHGFFRIHMHFARERRIVGADRQKGDLDVVTFADLPEALEISSVAAMKNGSTIGSNDEAAKAAMRVSEKTRAPMMRRRQRNAQRSKLDGLPFIKLVHNVET